MATGYGSRLELSRSNFRGFKKRGHYHPKTIESSKRFQYFFTVHVPTILLKNTSEKYFEKAKLLNDGKKLLSTHFSVRIIRLTRSLKNISFYTETKFTEPKFSNALTFKTFTHFTILPAILLKCQLLKAKLDSLHVLYQQLDCDNKILQLGNWTNNQVKITHVLETTLSVS